MERNCLNVTVSAWKNYFEAEHPKPVNLWKWLNSAKYAPQVQQIRAAKDKAERDRLKATLPAITPSGEFTHREEAGLVKHSGLIQFDVDGLTPEQAEYLKGQLCNLEEVAYLGLSVSGKGLWGLVPIAHPEKHRQHFEALAKDFLAWGISLDEKPKNVASLRGYSWDSEAYFNPQAKPYTKLAQYAPPKATKGPRLEGDEARKVEICLEQLEGGRIDITANYGDWLAVGFALADEFGEGGREYFHRASQFHPKYRPSEADGQFTACLNRKRRKQYGVGLFFDFCEQYGVTFIEQLKKERKEREQQEEKIQPQNCTHAPRPSLETVQAKQEANTAPVIGPYGYPASWDEGPPTGEALLVDFKRKNAALGKFVELLGLEVDE